MKSIQSFINESVMSSNRSAIKDMTKKIGSYDVKVFAQDGATYLWVSAYGNKCYSKKYSFGDKSAVEDYKKLKTEKDLLALPGFHSL